MGRAKLPRKSTMVDMTAMCDVAFLLLSFFILTTKFKSSEPVEVLTPSSVSSVPAPKADYILIIMNKDGKVFFGMDNEEKKAAMIEKINNDRKLGLSAAEKAKFAQLPFVGAPIASLKNFINLPEERRKDAFLPGVPYQDSANNEIQTWMQYAVDVYRGGKVNLMVKGDNNTKFPAFKGVIDAFKKTDQMKFQMVTNPEGAPEGTELYYKQLSGKQENE